MMSCSKRTNHQWWSARQIFQMYFELQSGSRTLFANRFKWYHSTQSCCERVPRRCVGNLSSCWDGQVTKG